MVGEITNSSYIIIPIIGVYVVFLSVKSFIIPFVRDMDFKTYYSLSWGNIILFLISILTAYFTLIQNNIEGIIIFSGAIFLLIFFYIFLHMFIIADPNFQNAFCSVHIKKSNANKTTLYKTGKIYDPRSRNVDRSIKLSQSVFILLLCVDILIVIFMTFLLYRLMRGSATGYYEKKSLAAASAFVSITVMILSITISTMYNEVAGKKNMLGYETKQICKKKGKIITGDTC